MTHRTSVALIALHFAEYSVNLARALANRVDVLLVLYRGNAGNELGDEWQVTLVGPHLQLLVLDAPRNALAVLQNTTLLISTVKAFGPSLIHYQEGIRDELVLSLPFFLTIPKVMTVHDPALHSGQDATKLRFSRLRLYRHLMRRATHAAIAHGTILAGALENECPWLVGKVQAIPHGPLGLTKAADATNMPGEMRLLFFGRIHKYKGLGNFVGAVTSLRRAGIPVVGVVAGTGSDLDLHREQMINAGCFEILDKYIPAHEVPKLFQQARIVVLPYTDGTQSGVAALALGHGRPVVATAVGSIPELVRHGINGLLVPPLDSTALNDAIRSILLDDQLWAALAQGAATLRDGELSWNTIATQTLTVYESVIS